MFLSRAFILIILIAAGCTSVDDNHSHKPPSPVEQISRPTSQPPSKSPSILQIDQGGHKASIKDIVFTPDGRYLVSAGEDKLIRVWDLDTKRPVRTLRGQIGTGFEGKIYAMTLSPDGRWLAAGGWTHTECAGRCGDIRLYDFKSGKLVTLLKGHTNAVTSLAFLTTTVFSYQAAVIKMPSFGMFHKGGCCTSCVGILTIFTPSLLCLIQSTL